jgi:multimeric flavodoxin WrbA
MSKVLVIYHSLSGQTERMAKAVAEGAASVAGTEVMLRKALEATVEELLACDAIAVGSPDYFSYMAGGVKDFFDRAFYPTQGKVTAKPCATFASAGGPATVVLACLDKMCFGAMKFKQAAESVGVSGGVTEETLRACQELGKKLAKAAK